MSYSLRAFFKQDQEPSPWVLQTPVDVDTLIDAVLSEPPTNSVITLYVAERPKTEHDMPDHELRVAINQESKVGGVRYSGPHDGGAGVWYAAGALSERDEVFYYYMGHDEGWPQDSEVSLDTIRAAVKSLLLSGGRMTDIQWREWPRLVS
ncbi:Imm1 family immunity protein [Kribbella solani]|uniref:Imm1 family immunity protein n=1 Tax=Kribbella solani TaxID=236067 RepID=UPI0029B57193|nr:Imm1 family immunity protein [Kribbella solani]MDX2972599.1 Imm1 family immunity protein [Kribbella solani]